MPATTDQTPMIRQYLEIKEKHRDAILMYRIGDFYEMFFDDATQASKILDIVLTSRNKNDPEPIPFCGVPYHSVEPYIAKLIEAGRKVAICDQVEDPREAKGVVRREVTRVVTPSLNINSESAGEFSYLVSLFPSSERWGIGIFELSTGEFKAAELSHEEICDEIRSRPVRELLLPESLSSAEWEKSDSLLVNRLPSWIFDETYARRLLQEQFHVTTLSGFDCEGIPLGVTAAGAILHYVRETQKTRFLPHMTSLKRHRRGDFLVYSDETYQSLEVNLLTELLDRTGTAMGGRQLRQWIRYPLTQKEAIESRLDAIDELTQHEAILADLQKPLDNIYDLERLTARLSLKTANARDLLALGTSLAILEELCRPLRQLASGRMSGISREWDSMTEIASRICKTLRPDLPLSVHEGGIIAEGVREDLDELRKIKQTGQESLAFIEKKERERTGISSLKVGFNRVFGYYIEVTTTHLRKVPPDYFRKQTLANAERFITPELKEFEGRILGADEKIRALEHQIFTELRDQVSCEIPRIKSQSERVAETDALVSLASVARQYRLTRPKVVEESILEIVAGRHLLVESTLPAGRFVPNDLHFDTEAERLLLITGPNMAGKSTVIRQAGLIVLMAQIGSFVPAETAVIGIVDRLFSRIGASDRLSRGESTFMVEMSETASILHHATSRSLILLDEIGRGTSTFDGLSLAWALAEYLHDSLKSRTLFATHYHELIDLALTRPGIRNYNVMVKEEGEEIVFLYRLAPGGMSHSYGIHVARLAGIPGEILERAKEVLKNMEQGEFERGTPRLGKRQKLFNNDQRTLF